MKLKSPKIPVHFNLELSTHLIEKSAFEDYLNALWVKLVKIKTPEAEIQLQNIEWMQRWLERQFYVNSQNMILSTTINELNRQIVKLEVQNKELIEENQKLKENI